MGIFGRLFSGDPRRDLERGEALLAKGEARRALELAERAAKSSSPVEQQRAAVLLSEAGEALTAEALEMAARAEASEYFEDAAEWLRSALEHVTEEGRRGELEGRIESLLARGEEAVRGETFDPLAGVDPVVAAAALEVDADDHFQALVGMLEDGAAERYAGQPAAFRRAVVDLHEGRLEGALEVLDELAIAAPDDPALILERGRGRLLAGDAAAARADFEAVWEIWGDGVLDLAGTVSVPALWAEAMLTLGEEQPVAESLAELAGERGDLAEPYARALLALERYDEASDFLAAAVPRFGGDQELPHLLATARARLGDHRGAIGCLEAAIAPSCAGGSCRKPPKHLPSFRTLAGLYLADDEEPALDRVRELLTQVAQAQGGRLAGVDHQLLAAYHQRVGDAEAAEQSLAEARRLSEAAG